MDLRLSISDGATLAHLALAGPEGTTWEQVVRTLPPGWPSDPCGYHVDGGRLGPVSTLGLPPLLHGALISCAPSTGPEPASPLRLVVAAGPDVGQQVGLPPGGSLVVGRGAGCGLTVRDGRCSRRHCRVSATRGGVQVVDLGSSNGGRIDGAEMPASVATPWRPGQVLAIGDTRLILLTAGAAPLPLTPDGAGRCTVVPIRLVRARPAPVELVSPDPPTPPRRAPRSVLTWLLPLVVSGGLALALRMPILLLFGLMAPAMAVGTSIGERRSNRREHREALARHTCAVREVDHREQECLRADLAARRRAHPGTAWALRTGAQRATGLWRRAPDDPVEVALGVGPVLAGVRRDGEPVTHREAPVVTDLSAGLTILAPPEQGRSVARALLAQVIVEHAPGDLALRWRTSGARPDEAWAWGAWVPHEGEPAARTLTVLDAADLPGPATAGAGLPPTPHLVLLDPGATPVSPGPQLSLEAGRWAYRPSPDAAPVLLVVDLLSAPRARALARRLAPLRPGGPGRSVGALPAGGVALVDLVRGGGALAELTREWREHPRSTCAVLGMGADGPVTIDLATDGPHALIGGTTGSGKSELLRTLVTSLALGNRPDELVFVLVDYKGGAAFADCAELPHAIGLITDLDPHLAHRALTSLRAELTRRERVLHEAGARDFGDLLSQASAARLPRLVIVIDEFRALADELPSFVDGLVRIAALGRSLGVHLVLATQRPAGIVSADIRANVNLRIALRMRDASDSLDVIETAAAADLPEHHPGRALLRTGSTPPRPVQVARVSGPTASAVVDELHVSELDSPWQRPPAPAPNLSPDHDAWLARVVADTGAAASAVGAVAPTSIWVDPLPDVLPLVSLPQAQDDMPGWGLADLPDDQRQTVLAWVPEVDGHLAFIGGPRTGRTTALRTVLTRVVDSRSPAQVHAYGFDLTGALAALAQLPHVGAWVDAEDIARGCRVLELLGELLEQRQRELAVHGWTGLADQRDSGLRAWPTVVWLVDGWGRFLDVYGEIQRGALGDLAHHLLRDGPAVGVYALITGDRALLTGRAAGLLPTMWALRLSDPTDLMLAGLPRSAVPSHLPPGRAVRLRDGVEAQVAVLGATGQGADQAAAVAEVVASAQAAAAADASTAPGEEGPRQVVALPARVSIGQAGALGVGGDGADPLELPADLERGARFVIAGPPRSGRSSALSTIAALAQARGHRTLLVDPSLPVDQADLGHQLEGDDALVVLVDDVHLLLDTPVEDRLLEWARGLSERGGGLVVADEPEVLAGTYRGLVPVATRDRCGVLLRPTAVADGACLGVQAPAGGLALPGRGVLVHRGTVTPIQIALAG